MHVGGCAEPRGHPVLGGGGGVLPKGPQGSPSRLPSPRRWESELRLFSAESWSVLTKLCLQRDSPEPPGAVTALPPLPVSPRGRAGCFGRALSPL